MSAQASIPSASSSVRRGSNNGVDRLSSLCDELLHHIMSFLPMPKVVRTSLLSQRWRNLWVSTPFIHIDHHCFKDENMLLGVDEDKLGKFGDHLLLLHDETVSLDEARIFVMDSDRAKSFVWIRHAIKHNARLLHVYGANCLVRLQSIAMCPSQHLKKSMLKSVCLLDGIFGQLNDNLPMLEHLQLDFLIVLTKAEILSRSLKTLHIICLFRMDFLICAENLTHLTILEPMYCTGALVTRDLSSLVTASIALSGRFHDSIDTIVNHRLLDGLSHATKLKLHAPSPELMFERGLQTCMIFSNLTSLVLGDWCMAADFYPLFHILHRSPKLKELILKLKMECCKRWKKAESASVLTRRAPSIRGYPCIERIKIYCRQYDPRVSTLVHALVPILIPDAKISIDHSIANLCG